TFTPLTSIVITSAVVSLPAGVSTQLTATGNFSGLFTRDITDQVSWSSDSPDDADFPQDFPSGRVKALAAGTATITATWAGNPTSWAGISAAPPGTFNLNVSDATIESLVVQPQQPDNLSVGLTQEFTALGIFSDKTQLPLTFDADWSSSDPSVASISVGRAETKVVSALKIGQTNIKANFADKVDSVALKVIAPSLVSIAVTPANPSLLSLSTQAFTATGKYSDGNSINITDSVQWDSSNKIFATIETNGTVKSLAQGTTTIKATLGTVSGTSSLKVTGGSLQSIALILDQAKSNELIKGTRSRIRAKGTFRNNTSGDITSRDITAAVTFGVDNINASVTPLSGNLAWLEAAAAPTATPVKISASYGTPVLTGEISLNVTETSLNSSGLTISEQSLTLASGTSGRLSLRGHFSPSSNQDLTPSATWTSSNPSVATVENGRVHAKSAGTANITATYDGRPVTTTVTVEPKILNKLTITAVSTPSSLIPGTEKQFTVKALYDGGFEQDVTENVEWLIDNSNVAIFSDQSSDPGLVVAVDAGETILRVKIGNIVDTETLTVSQ
ncbi:MAG: Ig-like domain-containing protein, partial [Desulfuromonadales bacterium]|nr:Ig-like domain-containing protein [Desulfuromonadales bacterium]